MTRLLPALCICALMFPGTQLAAHHSMAEYQTSGAVTIRGEVVSFEFRNPHSFIVLRVTEPGGAVVDYAVEWGAASQLAGRGISAATFRPGDALVITGFPAHNGVTRLRLMGVERPSDGFIFRHKPGEVLG